ncbi:uncharacterized protein LOC141638262 [Silene latifolia]|uniref:uncharacterized protein LOC141638262 n=1 Tax=Silene latifolia TaxID=37657 RepID=UPI003D76FEF6
MHRSSSNTRVADDFYKNSSAYYSSSSSSSSPANVDGEVGGNLPMYNPTSHVAKKERSHIRSAENAVHLIPLVLLLCAVILWFFSNPVDVVSKMPDTIVARHEGLKAAGGVDIDGTQNSLLAHLELDDSDLLRRNNIQQTNNRKRLI